MPTPGDLPHDLAVDSSGQVIIAGMFSHRMYRLNPVSGEMVQVEIPVPTANPRAVELGPAGDWFVLLGGPGQVARYSPATRRWSTWPIGMYPHSLGIGPDGRVWFNGHFSRDPELIGSLLPATGRIETAVVPRHPTLGSVPGGPIPYELRVAPDGSIWGSELAGNRIFSYRPGSRRFETWTLPTPVSGPRRFDIDRRGVLWIPAYSAGKLVKFEPASGRFTEIDLPVADALPYVARVDHGRDVVWIGTAAADAVLRYDIRAGQFAVIALSSRGALVRHLAVDPRTHDLWLAYGASPSRIAARVARLRESP
jgi:streptogramin lyase